MWFINLFRKLFFNIIVAFFTFLLIIVLPNALKAALKGNYQIYDAHYDGFVEFFIAKSKSFGYPYIVYIYLAFILYPFQVFKDVYFKAKRQKLSLFYKILVLIIFNVLFFAVATSIAGSDFQLYILIIHVVLAIVNAVLLYYLVDRYVEKV